MCSVGHKLGGKNPPQVHVMSPFSVTYSQEVPIGAVRHVRKNNKIKTTTHRWSEEAGIEKGAHKLYRHIHTHWPDFDLCINRRSRGKKDQLRQGKLPTHSSLASLNFNISDKGAN